MKSVFTKSLKDIFSLDVIGFILKVGLSSFLIMLFLFWMFWSNFSHFVASLVSHAPFIGGYEWFQTGVAAVASPFIAYGVILALISILTSLFSPKLLLKLAKKHYGIMGKDDSKIPEVIKVNLIATLKFFALTLLTLPLLFVPILGWILMLLLWAVLLKEPTIYDVKSLFSNYISNTPKGSSIWIISIIAATFNYIPFLNIFSALFAQILFMHHILSINKA